MDDTSDIVRALLAACGPVIPLADEAAFKAASCSGAYFGWVQALILEVAQWMEQQGIPEDDARALVAHMTRASATSAALRTETSLPELIQDQIIRKVQAFEGFCPDNDPWGEHDFGSFEHGGELIYWKIDCYDAQMDHGSPDPTDPDQTTRVLTVLLAEEW